jgi:AcrR family transcriptional regulator
VREFKKGRRKYESPLRRGQASQTRARILDSAEGLFAELGYAATTMDGIAAKAGVAVDTVYTTFGSKAGVLHRLLEVRVGGEDQAVALAERAESQAVLAERNAARLLVRFAEGSTETLERTAPVARIVRSAAAVDPEVGALLAREEETRLLHVRAVAGAVADRSRMRPGLTAMRAAAIIWTLASPEVHRLLRAERGWSRAVYSGWLGESLVRILID